MAGSADPKIRIRADLYETLKKRADDGRFEGVTITGLVEAALHTWLAQSPAPHQEALEAELHGAAKLNPGPSDPSIDDKTASTSSDREKSEGIGLSATMADSGKSDRAHALLALILQSNVKEVTNAIISNLEAFGLLVGAITGAREKISEREGSADSVPRREESVAELIERTNRLVDRIQAGSRDATGEDGKLARRTPGRRAS